MNSFNEKPRALAAAPRARPARTPPRAGVELYRGFLYCFCGNTAEDDDDHMPISFRDVAEIDAYVPTVPHPLPGEVPLVAADI